MRKIYISILLMILPCASANATTWTVTSLADSGAGTLRAAITSANADSGDTILFTGLSGTITLASALPTITSAMTIDGTGATVTVDGAGAYQAFYFYPGATNTLSLTNLQIQHCYDGTHGYMGGAIDCRGTTAFTMTVNLTGCYLTGNSCIRYLVSVQSPGNNVLNMTGCTVANNVMSNSSGATDVIYASGNNASADLINCTFAGNNYSASGTAPSRLIAISGGTYSSSVTNCTISGNISGNTNQALIQLIGNSAASLAVTNTITKGNTDINVAFLASGATGTVSYSDIDTVGELTNGGNNITSDPSLGSLTLNAPATIVPTMAITSSSPAFETGTASGAPTTDQRGIAANSPPSMGAFQVGAATPSAPIAPTSLTITSTDISGSTPGSLSSGSTTYSVEYSTDGGSTWTAVASTLTTGVGNLSTNAAWDTGAVFTPGTATNQVRYNAWNTSGNTEGAATANQTMVDGAPTGLTVTADTEALHLSWTSPGGVVTGYKGYYRVHNTGGYTLGYDGTSNTTTTGTITSLTAGVLYDVYVTALDVTGESAGSAVETGTPLAPVVAPTLTAALAANKAIVITGTLNGSGNLVNIYRGTSSEEESGTPIATSVSLPYTDNGRTNGTTYYYAAKSVEGDRLSVASNEVSGTPQAYGQYWP